MPAATAEDLSAARRILFHGVTGSGKSTAATRLGAVLDLPVTLVDEEIGWLPGWEMRDVDEQIARADRISSGAAWILDSAYGSYRPMVAERADLIVGLDYSRALTGRRLLRRTLSRNVRRTPTCNGNRETWARTVGKDSILRWHARTFDRKRAWIRARQTDPEGTPVLRLAHPRQWEQVLSRMSDARRG
mgnify:CR=1 FL=1